MAVTGVSRADGLRVAFPLLGTMSTTSTIPLPPASKPSFHAAVYERSIRRSSMNGPRSFTRTTTVLPLAVLVTRT